MLLLEQTNLSGGGLQILLVNNLALAIIQNVQKLAGERTNNENNGCVHWYQWAFSCFHYLGFLQVP